MQSFRQNFLILSAISCVLLLLIGCESQNQGPPVSAPEVTTVTVKTEKVVLTKQLPGRTSAYRVAEIRPQVSGLLQKRLFEEGSDVVMGQALYQIDPAPFEAALANAKAGLERAEANLPAIRLRAKRYKELLEENAVSQQEYDDAEASLTQIKADIEYWKASLETSKINLGYTEIAAPISGRIGKSNITEGAIVTAYQSIPLATIQQLDPIYADVPQSTTELLRLENRFKNSILKNNGTEQKKVQLILEDKTAYPFPGTFQFRDVTVDPTTGSVILRIVFPNPKGILLPHMFIRAIIQEGIEEHAILIPQQAVFRDTNGNPVVFIVDSDDKVRQRILQVDRTIGDKWLVSSGLEKGDRVIVEGIQKVRHGVSVKAIPFTTEIK